jgi:hypothetical protein
VERETGEGSVNPKLTLFFFYADNPRKARNQRIAPTIILGEN